MSERIDIVSELAPDVVLARIAAEAEWRIDDEGPAFPYDPGARRVNVRIQGIRFTMSMNAFMMRKTGGLVETNSFRPVCAGTVEATPSGGSRVVARFRFHWFTRLFTTVLLGMLGSMAIAMGDDRFRHATGITHSRSRRC